MIKARLVASIWFIWRYRLIIEYQGDQHRTDRFQWNRDIDRQEFLARTHWTLIRVTSERALAAAIGPRGLPGPRSQRLFGAAA